MPSLITGDEQTQVSLSFSSGSVIGDASIGEIPVFRSSSHDESLQILQLSGATLVSDRIQIGASVPLVQRQIRMQGDESGGTHVGDVTVGMGYEFLPEWSYSEWKPRGIGFIQLKLPTGRSVYEITASEPLYWGRGFYTLSMGAAFVKKWQLWDASISPEIHYSFNRDFQNASQTTIVLPGWGGSIAFTGGFRPGASDLRVGLTIQPIYEQPKEVVTFSELTRTAQQLVWNTSLSLSLLLNPSLSANLSYSDQTLLGPAINTTLTRTVALALNYSWLR